MSTHGSIAILNSDGSVNSIYNHSDSYPDYLGKILTTYHNNTEDANHIIELGDASFIDKNLDPIGEHSFDNPEDDCSIFYKRDRNESDTNAKHWECLDDWMEMAPDIYWADYMYLWNGEKWRCWENGTNEIDLYN